MPTPRLVTKHREPLRAEGNYGQGSQRQHERDERREEVRHLIDVRRQRVFLENKLHAVRQRLEQAVRSYAVRPPTRLDMRDHFTFDPGQIGVRR